MAAPIADDLAAAAAAEEAAAASPIDLLPTPEEIASATSGAQAHSTISMQSTPGTRGLGKGLGGTGLAPKRKAKGSGASTISAASAPPAIALQPSSSSSKGTTGLGAVSGDDNSDVGNSSGGTRKQAVKGSRSRQGKGSTAAKSSKQSMDSLPKEITESRSGKEMTQGHDEELDCPTEPSVKSNTPMQVTAAAAIAGSRAGTGTSNKGKEAETGADVDKQVELKIDDAGGWQAAVLDAFDAQTLVVCGTVLGMCAGCLLLFGSKAYFTSK